MRAKSFLREIPRMRAAFALFHSAICSARDQIALGITVTGEVLSDEATNFAAASPDSRAEDPRAGWCRNCRK